MEKLKQLYIDYESKSTELRKNANVFSEILGIGATVKNHPCHIEFHDAVLAWVADFVAAQPTSQQARDLSFFFLEEPQKYKGKDCYWFMYVCVGSIRDLVPLMSKEDCAAVAEKMNALYKKRERMPVQDQAYKMLLKAAK